MPVYFSVVLRAPRADNPYLFSSQNQMLSANNNNASMIPILDGSNYGAWSKVMRAFLRAQGLWQYINLHIERPNVLDPKKSTEDELKANKAALTEWVLGSKGPKGATCTSVCYLYIGSSRSELKA